MISLKSWSVLSCVRIQNILLAKVLLISWPHTRLAWGLAQTLDGEQDCRLFHADTKLLIQISPDGVKRGHFAQIDHLPFATRLVFTWMDVYILWSWSAIFHGWSLAQVWQVSGGDWLERSTYRHYWKFRARSELSLTLPINISLFNKC